MKSVLIMERYGTQAASGIKSEATAVDLIKGNMLLVVTNEGIEANINERKYGRTVPTRQEKTIEAGSK